MNSYLNPSARWLASPNYSPGRNGHDMTEPAFVVLHTMVGWLTSAAARFANGDPNQPGGPASATYGIGLDGTVVQWVDEADAAWANGATGRGGRGDNLDSISIEHEDGGDYGGPRTPELYAASAALVHDICTRYGLPIDRAHVIGHHECDYSSTACPDALDVDRIVRMAVALDVPAPDPAPAPPPPAPIPQEDDMGDIAYLDVTLELGQQHILYVDAKGALIQHVYVEASGTWETFHLATGLVPRAPVTAKVADDLKQVQVLARMADGRILHAWAIFGGDFTVEFRGDLDEPPAKTGTPG